MKIAVTILIILALMVAGLLVAIFWEQSPEGSNYSPPVPYETPEPPPEPVMGETPGINNGTPAGTPVNDDIASTQPNPDAGSAPATPTDNLSPDPTEAPDGTPSPSPAKQETGEELNDRRSIMLMQAEELYIAGRYGEALALLRKDETLFNEDTARLESEILTAMR